jgi:hypothetical protein
VCENTERAFTEGIFVLPEPAGRGAFGSRRFAAQVWGKSVLTVADPSEFSHGQDQERDNDAKPFRAW